MGLKVFKNMIGIGAVILAGLMDVRANLIRDNDPNLPKITNLELRDKIISQEVQALLNLTESSLEQENIPQTLEKLRVFAIQEIILSKY